MKKTIKILAIMLIAIALLFVTVQPTLALENVDDVLDNTLNAANTAGIPNEAATLTTTITNWIWWISIIVAVIVLMILGIKYMVGGVQDKSDYKKSLIPVVVGIIVIVFATTIVKVLFSMGS